MNVAVWVTLLSVAVVATVAAVIFFVPLKWGGPGDRYAFAMYDRWRALWSQQSQDTKRQNLRDLMVLIADVMESKAMTWYFTEGTALGLVREQDVIMGDTDVDIGVPCEYEERFHREIVPVFLSMGFAVSKSAPLKIVWRARNVYFDVDFVGADRPSMQIAWPRPASEFIDTIQPLQHVKANFEDTRCYPVPAMPYYAKLYGPNWRTPMSGKESKPLHWFQAEKETSLSK